MRGRNSLVVWASDRGLGGRVGRSPVRFPAPRGSVRGHFFVIFGMSWEVSGSGLGMFLDRFGKVLGKMSDGVRKLKFSKMAGSIFPESGRFRIAFLTYPRSNIIKKNPFSDPVGHFFQNLPKPV